MNREIKFRGLRTGGKGWVYGYYVFTYNRCYIIENEYYLLNEDNAEDNFIEVIPESVGQYTGLKDKDGKEIYEGDIMEVDKSIYSVVWSDAAFAALSPGSEAIDWHYPGFFKRSKAIGNIHEHKHLLS